MKELRELAFRLASTSGVHAGGEELELVVAALPPDLPFELPARDRTTIIGCVVTRRRTQILLDVALPADDVQRQYEVKLDEAGWRRVPEPQARYGFMSTSSPRPAVYCLSNYGPSLTVRAQVTNPTRTDLRLYLDAEPDPARSPCAPAETRNSERWPLPTLYPPPSSQQTAHWVGGDPAGSFGSARLLSQLDPQVIVDHYAEELVRAGWTPAGSGRAGQATYASFTVVDDEGFSGNGLLVLVQQPPASHRYVVYVAVWQDAVSEVWD